MSFEEKLDIVVARHEELEALLGSGDNVDGETFVKLSKELAGLKEIVEAIQAYKKIIADMEDAQALLDDPETDDEMRSMAHDEIYAAKEKLPEQEKKLKILFIDSKI